MSGKPKIRVNGGCEREELSGRLVQCSCFLHGRNGGGGGLKETWQAGNRGKGHRSHSRDLNSGLCHLISPSSCNLFNLLS